MSLVPPTLFTFDIFGTVVDWRAGLRRDLAPYGFELSDDDFDAVIDDQGVAESGSFRPYREIVAGSLVRVLGVPGPAAAAIGDQAGNWPLYPDSRRALEQLLEIAPCVATTNSDHAHGKQVQDQLGFPLSGWTCAEETRIYKPAEEFWRCVSQSRSVPFTPHWWHISAYADYDLETAGRLGLTRVFVRRPHSRPGPADITVTDLSELAHLAARSAGA